MRRSTASSWPDRSQTRPPEKRPRRTEGGNFYATPTSKFEFLFGKQLPYIAVAMISFVLLVILAIALWSVPPAVQSLWGIGMLAVFLHCLVDYPMQQRPALAAFFFAMLGCIWSSLWRERNFSPRVSPGL